MQFINPEKKQITESMLAECEAVCGLKLPQALRASYLFSNGGEPNPYVFQHENLDTVVSEFLPLTAESRGTAIKAYQRLVRDRKLVPLQFFPFAVDGGGDYFFADTSTPNGMVFFLRSDSRRGMSLLGLGLGVAEFWNALTPE